MKKINYVDDYGNELKKVTVYFEIVYSGQTIETTLLLPKDMTDREILEVARQFRDGETKCGWYYPEEEEEGDEI